MRQTAKTQVTDIREAVIGKDAGEKAKHRRRRLKRLAGRMDGQASDLTSSKLDLMHIALAMQKACVVDNAQHNGVLKAFRMAGWLSHKPTQAGLVPLVGPEWRDYLLGSSRMSTEVIHKRMSMVPLGREVPPPDWSQLQALRRRQRLAYVQNRGNAISDDRKRELLSDDTANDGFISFLGGWGQKAFEEQDAQDAEQPKMADCRLSLVGVISADALAEDAAFLALHPRVWNAILAGGAISKMPRCRKSSKATSAQRRVAKSMSKKTTAYKKKEKWRKKVDDLGMGEAKKQLCVPSLVRKAAKKTKRKKTGRRGVAGKFRRNSQRRSSEKRAMASSFTAEVKALRDKIEEQVAKLGQAAGETQKEQRAVENDAGALVEASEEQARSPEAVAERKRLRGGGC